MSREIKFRAWDIKGKEMLVAWPLPTIYPSDVLYSTQSIGVRPDDKRFELMQYTGLHDRNGVEIYEGDIVKFNGENVRVFYTPGEYWMSSTDSSRRINSSATILGNIWQDSKVIGNIYENPDLLKEHNHGE